MEELDEIKCIICFELFDQPVSLYCGHTFCKDCILAHFEKTTKCPVCKFTILNSHDLKINKVLEGLLKVRVLGTASNNVAESRKLPKEPNLLRSEAVIESLNNLADNKPVSPDQRSIVKQLANKMGEISRRQLEITPVYNASFNTEKNDDAFIDKIKYEKQNATVNLFCFQLANQQINSYYVPQSVYNLKLAYTYTDDLFYSLVEEKFFIVIPQSELLETQTGYIFKFIKMNYYSDTSINVTASCISPLVKARVYLLDIAEHYDYLISIERRPEELEIPWMRASMPTAENFEMDENTLKLFKTINFKFLHFLHRLKDNNREMFDKLTEHHDFTITDQKLSIDYVSETEEYIHLLFSLLRIPEETKRKLSVDTDPTKKLKAIKQFLDKSRPYSDPIYIINYCPDMNTRKQIHLTALCLIFMTLIYSIFMVHFNITFIF